MRVLGIGIFGLFFVTTFALAADATVNPADYPVIGKFRNTYYYSVPESMYPNATVDNVIKDMDDTVLAKVSTAFKKDLDIEGSGRLNDGRIVNFAGIKNKEIRYHVTIHPYGRGVGNCALSPFHTIAVDPTKIALGSVVFIDETLGMKLPDGTLHDGFWKAEDIGGAIKKDRVDLFVGEGDQGSYLEHVGIVTLKALTVRLVTAPPADSCINHDPQ
jgi:3D (Asp-Asp-Asp) domain-containing protein